MVLARYSTLGSFALVLTSLGLVALPACSDDASSDTEESDDDDATDDADDADADDDATDDSADDSSADDDSATADDSSADDDASDDDANPAAPNADRGRLAGVRDACMDYCDAQFAVECQNFQQSIEVCDLQCVAAISTSGDFCIDEYEAQIQCLADGGYECVQDRPIPKSTCSSQQLEYIECARDLPCKLHCAALTAEGCENDEDACFDSCIETRTDLEDTSCQFRYDNMITCSAQQGLECVDGQEVIPEVCISALFDYHECANEGNLCEAWCAVSDALGCDDAGCIDDCEAAFLDPDCGGDYQRLLECGMRYSRVQCEDGKLATEIDVLCDSEAERYDECLAAAP